MDRLKKYNLSKIIAMGGFLVGALLIGTVTFILLKHTDAPRSGSTSNTTDTTKAQSTDTLVTSAMNKLKAGKQEEGIAELQSALVIAKKDNDTAKISYIEQQIDFAKNSDFSKQETPAPAPKIDTKSPNYISY